MSEQDTLLDVVVNIKPNNDIQKALDAALRESLSAATRTLSAFNLRVENATKKMIENLQQIIAQFNAANLAFASASRTVAAVGAAGGPPVDNSAATAGPARRRPKAVADETKDAVAETKNSLVILRNATDDALKSTRELLTSSRGVVTETLQSEIQNQIDELRRLRTEIARDIQIVNKAPETAAASLQDFRTRAFVMSNTGSQLSNTAATQTANRAEMERLMAQFRQDQQSFAIRERLAMSQIRGLPSAGARAELAVGKSQIASEVQYVMKLKDAFDGSAESVEQLRQAIQRLSGTTDARGRIAEAGSFEKQIGLIDKSARDLPVSMNTLRNDFYQMGQAFEDAGIGYELNGWPGAIRGASNNVLFLANSFIQTDAAQQKLTDGLMNMFGMTEKAAAKVVPMALGYGMIGLSIATIVLPRMVEWLESLNDIDYKMRDLSETLQRSFAAQDFTIDLRIGEAEFRRQLQDLESVEDVLKRIRDLEIETADNAQRMREQMRGMFALGEFEDTITALERIVPVFQQQSDEMVMSRAREILDERTRLRFTLETEPSKADIKRAKQELSDLQQIRSALANLATGFDGEINGSMRKGVTLFDQLSESFEQGSFNATQIRNVANQLRVLQDAIPTLPLDATDEKTAENYTNTIGVLIKRLEELGNSAEKNASQIGKNLTDAMDVAIRKTAELADRQALLRMQLLGMADEDSTFLLDFRDAVVEYNRLVQQQAAFARSQNVPEQQVARFERVVGRQGQVEATNKLLEEQKRITDEIRKKEEQLTDLVQKREDRRSRSIQLEAYLRQLQENALSPDVSATKDNTDAIRELTRELQSLRSQQEKTRVLEDLIRTGQADKVAFSATAMALLPSQMQSTLAGFGSFAGAGMTGLGPLGGLAGVVGVEALAPVFDRVGIEIVRAVNNTTSAIQQTGKVPARTAP